MGHKLPSLPKDAPCVTFARSECRLILRQSDIYGLLIDFGMPFLPSSGFLHNGSASLGGVNRGHFDFEVYVEDIFPGIDVTQASKLALFRWLLLGLKKRIDQENLISGSILSDHATKFGFRPPHLRPRQFQNQAVV